MPILTVFTPTYNRAYVLSKCYESMKRQSCKDFVWLVVDDGSTDNTRDLVENWKLEDIEFELRYVYQENQGMHSAHNLAYVNIGTEINSCIDSDDYMPDDAVEKIINFWNTCEKNEKISGFLALDAYENGDIIGTHFPENVKCATSYEYYYKFKIKGDKKFVLRSDLTKINPYPVFIGEKYVNLATKYSLLDVDYKLLNLNETVCIVKYLADGSTLNMFRQYLNNPKGFAYSRRLCMALPFVGQGFRFKQAIHYVSACIISKNRFWFRETPRKALTIAAAPLGGFLWCYIIFMAKKRK